MGKRVSSFNWLIIFIGLILVLTSHPASLAGDFPQEMAGLKLLSKAEGEEAKKQVYALHGKDLKLDEAFVLRYGNPANTSSIATVWVSRSKDEEKAKGLFERMTGAIKGGAGPYGHLKELSYDNTYVISLYGKDKRHYIYRTGKDLIWIEVDYPPAEEFLKEALAKLKRAN